MRKTWALYKKELRSYFVSPLFYVVAAVFFIFLTIPLARFTDHLIAVREQRERAQAL